MSSPLKKLNFPKQRRIERLNGEHLPGLRVQISVSDSESYYGEILNFHSQSLLIRVPTGLCSRIESGPAVSFSAVYGAETLFKLEKYVVEKINHADSTCLLKQAAGGDSGARRNVRLALKDTFPIIGLAKDPFRSGSFIHFEVLDINARGLLIRTSLSNKHLLIGTTLPATQLMISGVGMQSCDIRMLRLQEDSSNNLKFGCEFIDPSNELIEAISTYATFGAKKEDLLFSEHLRTAGLSGKSLRRGIKYSLIESDSDLEQALALRLKAYKNANKLRPDATVDEMHDEYDRRAAILVAKVDGKVIGTARLVRCLTENDRFQFEGLFAHLDMKKYDRYRFVEVSKLAIDPDVQGSDVVVGFFSFIYEFTSKSYVTGVFCFATSSLLPLYLKVGGNPLSTGAVHPVTQENMSLLLITIENVTRANHIPALSWQAVAKNVVPDLNRYGFSEGAPSEFRIKLQARLERLFIRFLNKKKRLKTKAK